MKKKLNLLTKEEAFPILSIICPNYNLTLPLILDDPNSLPLIIIMLWEIY